MLYYKVKKDCDQLPISKNGKWNGFLIANELYTQTEVDQKITDWNTYKLCFDVVELSKNNTVFIFGARFEKAL